MRGAWRGLIVVVCVGIAASGAWAQSRSAKNKAGADPEPVPGYKFRQIWGFNLLVNKEVLAENEKSTVRRKPMQVLELELGMLSKELTPKAVNALRELAFWVEWDKVLEVSSQSPQGGRAVACYHPGPTNEPGSNRVRRYVFSSLEAKAKSNAVEIVSMKALTAEHQGELHRSVLLHEVTHAIHHHYIPFGYENPQIKAAYQNAMHKRLYAGEYASTNANEYFAEISCAYFGHLHYQPHDREELQQYDPAGYDLMEKLWGKPQVIAAEIKADLEKQAMPKLANARRLLSAKKTADAVVGLQSLIDDFPDTKAATEARKLLAKANAAAKPAAGDGEKK